MKKFFKNYEHYCKWIITNWKYQITDLDQEIIENGFLIEINHLETVAYRLMFKSEFKKVFK